MATTSGAPACAVSELIVRGMESATALHALLGQQPPAAAGPSAAAPPGGLEDLTEQIVRCCGRALAALGAAGGAGKQRMPKRGLPAARPATTRSKRMRLMSGGGSTTRVEKKRTLEDGFVWTKYGQKNILGSKYPRLYFRCSYKDGQGCMAKRQVQRSEADPAVCVITYFGDHTCLRFDGAPEPPAPFVIDFGSGATSDVKPASCSLAWPSRCDNDDGLHYLASTETSSDLCNSPELEELRAAMADQFIVEQSAAPVPELTRSTRNSPGWDPLDGCLDWELGDGEVSFDIAEFIYPSPQCWSASVGGIARGTVQKDRSALA